MDGEGKVYVADYGNQRVQVFDSEGQFVREWGTPGGIGDGQFAGLNAIAVDRAGNVYVADSPGHRLQKFDAGGRLLGICGNKGSYESQFDQPLGIAVDGSDNVYVTNAGNDRIQVFDTDGPVPARAGVWGRRRRRILAS